jgi:pimeloyl-ACP methyl ester carboxylesterase
MAVIFINAGLIHHVGPHRLHVRLAHGLAAHGIASLRLDLSGIGDSPPRTDHLPIHDLVRREPADAITALSGLGLRRFVLIGLCSGAYSAFHVACDDERVTAAVMINPESLTGAADDQSAAWVHRYWSRSALRPRAWMNLITGKSNYRRMLQTLAGAAARLWRTSPPDGAAPADPQAALRARVVELLGSRPLRLLFVSSEHDVSREYLDLLFDRFTLAQLPANSLQRHTQVDSDHLFTREVDQRGLVKTLIDWLTGIEAQR